MQVQLFCRAIDINFDLSFACASREDFGNTAHLCRCVLVLTDTYVVLCLNFMSCLICLFAVYTFHVVYFVML